ncbi:erythromycin esterase family protein [Chondromyces crocatus]|uniref:erythromycin esterase family protein n=1 Tax=Chondromyces crocatus TaxID=52 RepID=UPI001470063D|nr:erythromycin esterase family protein [Chondromyces crocatus]
MPRLTFLLPVLGMIAACAGAPVEPSAQPPTASTRAGAATPTPPRAGDIDGVIQGPDGKPVAGALVSVVAADTDETRAAGQAFTGPEGRFRVSGLPSGRYGITVTAPGLTGAYLDVFQHRETAPTEKLAIQLGGEGMTVEGAVRDKAGRPVPGAMVSLIGFSYFDADIFFAPVDGDGRYQVKVPEGRYHLAAQAPGHADEGKTVTESTTLDRTLQRAFPADQLAPEAVSTWLRANVAPIASVEVGRGFTDLAPVTAMIGEAKVVSLGEATRGTREFFQLKHRMLEVLVHQKGFRVFGIEASFAEALVVNDYIRTGKGDPVSAVRGLRFWTWDTEEVVALVRWMRAYNEDPSHPQKLAFHGFDIQSPASSVRALLTYLRQVDRSFGAEAEQALRPLDSQFDVFRYDRRGASVWEATRTGLERIAQRLESERDGYIQRSSAAAWKTARLHLDVVRQAEPGLAQGGDAPGTRDQAMAKNVLSLLDLEGPQAKMVLWAHNLHVARGQLNGSATMGEHLHQALGKDQVSLGLAFDQGSFQAQDISPGALRALRDFSVGVLQKGSLDATLGRLGVPILALDLRRAPAGSEAAAWLEAPLQSRTIGPSFQEGAASSYVREISPRASFDALLFVERTTAARPTQGDRPPPPPNRGPLPLPVNLGFEEVDAQDTALGWWNPPLSTSGDPAQRVTTVGKPSRSGKRAALIQVEPRDERLADEIGMLVQKVDAAPYQGQRVRLDVAVRTARLAPRSRARLFLEVVGTNRQMFRYVDTLERPITGTTWRDHTLEIDVPADATTLTMGLMLVGEGQAFFDDVRLKAVGAK